MGYISLNLDELREQRANYPLRHPFQHQIESFAALDKTFKAKTGKTGSGILALPTGAGKTFTSVKWLIDHVIPDNIRILWLAPSFYLLDQAFAELYNNAHEISSSRQYLNIRRVSSNSHHAPASSIQLTDDVIIMTIPTAISNLNTNALDGHGKIVKTALRKHVEHYQDSEFFVVIDEAHHSPAYGCRNLLIGNSESNKPGLRTLLPKSQFLGLTATPTHNDKTIRGWLWEIFKDEVIYKAEKATLIAQGILARPNYIEVPTGKKVEVDDALFSRLTRQHKDLPESIIEILARDKDRNNLIVNAYVKNKEKYGKTIIFADRWFQCVYLKEKLLEQGVQADAIYSHIDADPDAISGSQQRDTNKNQKILQRFKTGKDEYGNDAPLDVLINVRMLTEGADVPSVRTVFLTRQTTSSILMTQMIGRALRGEKAGGGSEANIVLFFDEWERLIDWAVPDGDTVDKKPSVKGYFPLEYISICLLEELSKHIKNPDIPLPPFSTIFPVGWYQTDVVYANTDGQTESMESFVEFVMAYEHNKEKFDAFIEFISNDVSLDDEWAREDLDENWGQPQIVRWAEQYFDLNSDNFGNRLYADLTRLVRHIAQTEEKPPYYSFSDRWRYNLDNLAAAWTDLSFKTLKEELKKEFSSPGLLWKTFYKTFSRFETAASAAIMRILDEEPGSPPPPPPLPPPPSISFTPEQRDQIIRRDGYQCLCCGIDSQRVKLQVDHIMPYKFGGQTVIENGQMLCQPCNSTKYVGTHEINFRQSRSPLEKSKDRTELQNLLSKPNSDNNPIRSLTRVINIFYHCRAVKTLDCDFTNRRSPHYYVWTIRLHEGNDPNWLLSYKKDLMAGIHQKLGSAYLRDIQICVSE